MLVNPAQYSYFRRAEGSNCWKDSLNQYVLILNDLPTVDAHALDGGQDTILGAMATECVKLTAKNSATMVLAAMTKVGAHRPAVDFRIVLHGGSRRVDRILAQTSASQVYLNIAIVSERVTCEHFSSRRGKFSFHQGSRTTELGVLRHRNITLAKYIERIAEL